MKENNESAVPLRQTQTKRNRKYPSALGLMAKRDATDKCVLCIRYCYVCLLQQVTKCQVHFFISSQG